MNRDPEIPAEREITVGELIENARTGDLESSGGHSTVGIETGVVTSADLKQLATDVVKKSDARRGDRCRSSDPRGR